MHLRGTADIAELTDRPKVTSLASELTELGECRLIHLTFESPMNTDVLPPAVHPSIPNHVSILAWDAPHTPFGPARLVQVRLGCIVSILPRGLVTVAITDNAELALLLTSRYGMHTMVAEIEFIDDDKGAHIRVVHDDSCILSASMQGSDEVVGGSTAVFSSISLATVADELRLVQTDFTMELAEPTRGIPQLDTFDAVALGAVGAVPCWAVSAVATHGPISIRPVRYSLDAFTPGSVDFLPPR
jgi:hypothetical protein